MLPNVPTLTFAANFWPTLGVLGVSTFGLVASPTNRPAGDARIGPVVDGVVLGAELRERAGQKPQTTGRNRRRGRQGELGARGGARALRASGLLAGRAHHGEARDDHVGAAGVVGGELLR